MLTAKLLRPRSLTILGHYFTKGVPTPVDLDQARVLAADKRFEVRGLTEVVAEIATSTLDMPVEPTPDAPAPAADVTVDAKAAKGGVKIVRKTPAKPAKVPEKVEPQPLQEPDPQAQTSSTPAPTEAATQTPPADAPGKDPSTEGAMEV